MMKKTLIALAVPALALGLASCSSAPSSADYDKMTADVIKASFVERGIAKLDRLDQDMSNAACWQAEVAGKPLDEKTAKAIEAAEMKTIKWPTDGKFLGDWKQGEAIAQSGRGLTFTDSADTVNGGNCYNCHELSKKEISYGTIGPSLHHYGRIRGVTDPNSPSAKPIVEYTWGKIWNSKAFNACSNMPRAGHMGVLTEAQIRHVMALLLDPQSIVNQP